jgi:hypothetical protein
VKCLPVVEVVEIDGVCGFSVGEAASGEDFLAGLVLVLISGDGGVELGDGSLVELGSVFGEKFLELDVGRFFLGDESDKRIAIHAERVEHHHVIAGAAVAVAIGELVGGSERHFLPEAWEVKDTERARGSGGDGGNGFVTHDMETVNFNAQLSTAKGERVFNEEGRKAGKERWL